MLRKRSQLMAVFCILTLVSPGCSKKQTFVSAPQEAENPYKKSSPKSLSDQIRSVFKISEINRWAKKQADTSVVLQRYPEIEKTLAQVEKDPSDLGAKRRLADFYASKKLYRRALQVYAELGAILPDDAGVQLALARIWDLQGAPSIALRHAVNAVELEPDSVEALSLLGMVHLHREEPQKASKALASALELSPDNGDLLANIGFAFLQMKDWKQAAGYLESALRSHPDSAKIRNNLGIAKVYLGDEEGAIEEFLKVSEPAVAYNNLGAAYLANKQWAEARDALEISLAWKPGYVKAELNLLEAESYLPPPNIVDLGKFNTRLAWLQSSWEEHIGINTQSVFNLPKQRLFRSAESFPVPLQRLALPMQSTSTNFSGQLPFRSIEEEGLPFPHGIIEEKILAPGQQADGAPPEDQTTDLAELEPVPFTVRQAEAPVSLEQAESPLTALLPDTAQSEREVQLPSPVDMSKMGTLLSHVISAPIQTLGRISPDRNQPLSNVKLAGGDLLNMVVERPGFDWNAVAQAPEASYSVESDDTPVESTALLKSQPIPFPAQVWLVPNSNLPVAAAIEDSAPVPQTVQNSAAMQSVEFPFQLFRNPVAIPKGPIQETAVVALAEESRQTVAIEEMKVAEPDPVPEIKTSKVLARTVEPIPEVSAVALEYSAHSFDQFAALREQVLANRTDTPEDQEMNSGMPVRASGLAGLAGAALILFSLGTTQLYFRFRSPFKRLGILEKDPK